MKKDKDRYSGKAHFRVFGDRFWIKLGFCNSKLFQKKLFWIQFWANFMCLCCSFETRRFWAKFLCFQLRLQLFWAFLHAFLLGPSPECPSPLESQSYTNAQRQRGLMRNNRWPTLLCSRNTIIQNHFQKRKNFGVEFWIRIFLSLVAAT